MPHRLPEGQELGTSFDYDRRSLNHPWIAMSGGVSMVEIDVDSRTRSRDHEQYHTQGERPVSHAGYRAGHAAAVRPPQRPRPARTQIRMRSWPVRRMYGNHQ